MDDLTRDLKEHALELGFDLVGVAVAGPCDGGPSLRNWLAAGMHGEMGYMADTRDLREDPRRLLAGCRSVVAVAMSYHSSHPASYENTDPERVWVSRYAWGRDYHKTLKKKLVRLGRWLVDRSPGTAWRAGVDTLPVMERSWAAAAGLGWIGKNTQLMNRELGSELFLGVLLTDARLEPDAPTTAHCGRCTACLDACPTGAFPAPGVLDARRCVAYLTVEHRGEVADELQSGIGVKVAGCDICQEVCPWTRRAPADLHPDFLPAARRYQPRLHQLMALDVAGYREWRAGSALNRIPFVCFRRNLEIAGNNCGQ